MGSSTSNTTSLILWLVIVGLTATIIGVVAGIVRWMATYNIWEAIWGGGGAFVAGAVLGAALIALFR